MNKEHLKPPTLEVNELDPEVISYIENEGYDIHEYYKSGITTCSYLICYALYSALNAARSLSSIVKSHPLNSYRGFGRELRTLLSEAEQMWTRNSIHLSLDEMDRIRTMCNETQPYLDDVILKMRYGIQNYLSFYHLNDYKLMTECIICQTITDMSIHVAEDNLYALYGYSCRLYNDHKDLAAQKYIKMYNYIPPRRLNQLACELSTKVATLLNNKEETTDGRIDINKCDALNIGRESIKCIMCDIKLMEMHCAFGLEQTHGKDWLLKNDPNTYKILHPNYKSI